MHGLHIATPMSLSYLNVSMSVPAPCPHFPHTKWQTALSLISALCTCRNSLHCNSLNCTTALLSCSESSLPVAPVKSRIEKSFAPSTDTAAGLCHSSEHCFALPSTRWTANISSTAVFKIVLGSFKPSQLISCVSARVSPVDLYSLASKNDPSPAARINS